MFSFILCYEELRRWFDGIELKSAFLLKQKREMEPCAFIPWMNLCLDRNYYAFFFYHMFFLLYGGSTWKWEMIMNFAMEEGSNECLLGEAVSSSSISL